MGDPEARIRFADLEVGHEVVTHSRTIAEADVREFAGVSGVFSLWAHSLRGHRY